MVKYQSYKRLKIMVGILLCILFLMISYCVSHANSPPLVMKGSTAFPINSDYIVLEKETINIKYGKERHSVEVVFYFYNTGPETDLQIGFPNVANYGKSLYDFKAFQYPDRIEYEVEEKPGGQMPGLDQYMYERMYSWTMHFDEGERKALLVTYRFYNTTMTENDGGSASYILKTGALWKGKIGSIDVSVEFPEKAAYHELTASPSGYYYNGSGIEWHFEDIEPDFDLDIFYHKLADNLKLDWMYEPKYNGAVSDYIWNDKIFVVDLFERWNLEEEFYFNDRRSGTEVKIEAKNLLENCLLVKNEILARHGAALSGEWDDFFRQFPWYAPEEGFTEDNIKAALNETEKLNLELIRIYEEHIFPDADVETINKGMHDLYEKYGDAFFRYYPVFKRLENRETIQSFIDQRIKGWEEYKPLHLGQANPGFVKSPAILNKVERTNSKDIHNYGQTEDGFSILATTDDRLLLKKENVFYEIYKRTVPDTMYERRHEIPFNSAFVMNLEFHDFEMGHIIKKWCKEIKDLETGETMSLIDDLLILPEEGEKCVLTGFNIYDKNNAWSDNCNYLAYTLELNGMPYLQVFGIENRHLMRYPLPEDFEFQELIILNDGSGFLRYNDSIFSFKPENDSIVSVGLTGQFIGFDYNRESLIYIDQNEIHQYSSEKGDSFVITLPKEIWKVEKQDQNNYLLYCHPEYYYIFNLSNQAIYRYPQITGYPHALIFSPSGFLRLEQFSDTPPVLTKGNTNEQADKTNEQKELNLPSTYRYEWLTDRELAMTEYLNIPESEDGLTLEHIYDVESEEKLSTRSIKKNYTDKAMSDITDSCYFHSGKPVLANALITSPKAYPGSIFSGKSEYKSGVPVGILETDNFTSNVVYYNVWNNSIATYNVDNKYLELIEETKVLPFGFIVDSVVYIDEAKQDTLLEKCSAFVSVIEKNGDSIKVKIANILEGWIDIEDLVPGFVSIDKTQNISLPPEEDTPDDSTTDSTSAPQSDSTDALDTEDNEDSEAIEAVKISSEYNKVILRRGIYVIAILLIIAAVGIYLVNREKRKQEK